MKKEIVIGKAVPWTEFNEVEGHIDGIIDGHELCVKVFFYDENEWKLFSSGKKIVIDLWIERRGELKIMPRETPPEFLQEAGVNYAIVGKVIEINGEIVILKSIIDITVDLELGPESVNKIAKEIMSGDIILVTGVLKADIHPD